MTYDHEATGDLVEIGTVSADTKGVQLGRDDEEFGQQIKLGLAND